MMSGLPVTNGPSGHNGEAQHVWERPWSLDEIRKSSADWSLAADSGLFLYLQDFSQRMLSKTHEIEKQLDGLIRDTKATDCCLHTVFNDFLMLSNTQFIENRVYDDEVEEPTHKPDVADKLPELEKTREQKEAELIPKVQEAVNYGLTVLESAFEQLDIKAGNSDSEDEDATGRVEPILEPKDLYLDRPLPYLIGSQLFMEQDDVGLGDLSSEEMSIDSDRDSVIDSEEDKGEDQSDEDFDQDYSGQERTKKKSSVISDDDEGAEEEDDDSDIFGESDKEDEDDRKMSTGPSSFADELAARIKGDAASKPEDGLPSSAPSSTKKKSKEKRESKDDSKHVLEESDELFQPPPMDDEDEEEDHSPFGGKGGIFSGGRGLFDDDDDEGDLFSEAPKQEAEDHSSKAADITEPEVHKPIKKIPVGAVSIFPAQSSLFTSHRDSDSEGGSAKQQPRPQPTPKKVTTGGLFDDEDEEDDFFNVSTLKKSSTGLEKASHKKGLDLFGGDDEEDEGGIFSESSRASPPAPCGSKKVDPEGGSQVPEKKLPVGATSIFGPGTINMLEDALKKRRTSNSEESEKSEENSPPLTAAKPTTKPVEKPQLKSLFSDDEDTQIFPTTTKTPTKPQAAVPSKPSKATLSIFDDDDDEEEDLFASTTKPKTSSQVKTEPAPKVSKPVSSALFSDDEDQWISSKPSAVASDTKAGGMKASVSSPSRLPTVKTPQKNNPFDDEDDLFVTTKEPSQKKSQRVSLLFEDEDEQEEKAPLFAAPQATSSASTTVKVSSPPSLCDKAGESQSPSAPQEVNQKKLPGAVSLFGGIDVLGGRTDSVKQASPLEEPEEMDGPPPMDEPPKTKKKVVSLFDDDDETDDDDSNESDFRSSITSSTQLNKDALKQEERTRTTSTGVFKDEELLFSQKQQKDNDPDVDLFATTGKSASAAPSDPKPPVKPAEKPSMKSLFSDDEDSQVGQVIKQISSLPAAPALFGDDDEDDLFSTARPKSLPKSAVPVKSKEPTSRIGKLQAGLALDPSALLPGAVPHMPAAVSAPSLQTYTLPSPVHTTVPDFGSSAGAQRKGEAALSFDSPAQATTLQSANKGRVKHAGKRRPQSRAARLLATQQSDQFRDTATAVDHQATSLPQPAPSKTSSLKLPATKNEGRVSPDGAKPSDPPISRHDLPGSGSTVPSKQTPEMWNPEAAPNLTLRKEATASLFDDNEDDLFRTVQRKPAKKASAVPFLEEEDDDIFAVGKSSTAGAKSEAKPKAASLERVIFQDEVDKPKAPKKLTDKSLDASLFDDDIDIFADLGATATPKEKKSKKKVETKSIFEDDMDDIFAASSIKPVAKTNGKAAKKSPATQEANAPDTAGNMFDDPLNALGGN